MSAEEFFASLTQAKALFIGLVIAGIYYFVMFDDGSNLQRQIQSTQSNITKQEADIQKYKETIKIVEGFKKKISSLGDQFADLVKYIPEKFNSVEQMKVISGEAKAAGLNIISIASSGVGEKKQFYQELLVEVNLRGSYSQLMLFLSYLTRLDKVLVLKSMTFGSQAGPDALGPDGMIVDFKGTFAGYKYSEEEDKKTR